MGSSASAASISKPWPVPDRELERLAELLSFQVGPEGESEFNQIVELASDLFDMPIALLNLMYDDHAKVKARVGIDAEQVPRELAFCSYTVAGEDVLVVEDLAQDKRFADNPLVSGDNGLRFYAGAPLKTQNGLNIGALCVIDTRPRPALSERQQRTLKRLSELVMDKLELRRLRIADTIASQFAAHTADAFLCVNSQGLISYWNKAAEALFGYCGEEALGRSLDIIVPERFRGAHAKGMGRVAAGGTSKLAGRPVELVARRKTGEEFPIELLISVWDEHGTRGMGAIIRDLTERRQHQERLEHLAMNDQLTGVPNRFCFVQRLSETLSEGQPATVLAFDLDGFKGVNDSLGHGIGDALLQALTIRLLAHLEPSTTLARLGGDEFAVLLPGCADPLKSVALAETLLTALADPFTIDTHHLTLGMSVGIAETGLVDPDPEQLMSAADIALYEAKTEGGARCRVYEPHMRDRFVGRRNLQVELGRAARDGEFVLHYQPQVSLTDRSLIGCEALLRWQHPERGLLYPNAFISALEGTAAVADVGWFVLEEACRQLAAWDKVGFRLDRMGVNLFSAQFRAPDFKQRVLAALDRHGLQPERIELEITETIALRQDDGAITPLRELRGLGIGLAFDDFGTGFASLSTLKRFPLTRLKIDRSFVGDLARDPHDAAIVKAVITMGQSLNLSIIAEGIETETQMRQLTKLGCIEGQGYLFGKALAPEMLRRAFSAQEIAVA